MYICHKQVGTVHELGGNPLAAMLMARAFAGRRFHRGLPPLSYAALKSERFEELDEANRQHVEWVLKDRAKKLGCSLSDLAWATAPQKNGEGIHPVMVKKWEEIERQEFARKKAE